MLYAHEADAPDAQEWYVIAIIVYYFIYFLLALGPALRVGPWAMPMVVFWSTRETIIEEIVYKDIGKMFPPNGNLEWKAVNPYHL